MTLDAALPTLFHALVHVDAASTVTRRRTFRDELATEPPLPRLIETLVQGRLLRAEDTGGRATITVAHEALLAAWPALHEWVEANRARLQRFHRLLLSLAPDNPPEDRRYAVTALSNMVTVMPDAVPTLIPAVVPALIAALVDADGTVHEAAAKTLGEIGSEAVPALITALADVDLDVRQGAVRALVH